MADTYFNYTLSNCESLIIKNICERFPTIIKLKSSASNDWIEYKEILCDSEIVRAISVFFEQSKEHDIGIYLGDSQIIYNRCNSAFLHLREEWGKGKVLDYDRLFDILVDVNWILASRYDSIQNNQRYVYLLSDQSRMRKAIRLFLDTVYVSAINYHNESIYVTEGIEAKKQHPFIPWLYDNQYNESYKYIRSDITLKELQEGKTFCKNACRNNLTMYYCLTATAALAESIRRGD